MNATLAQEKPFFLCFDPVRGGASLPDIEAECNASLRLKVFGPLGAKRDVIIWHRFKDFQIASIKLMAEQLLRGCPQEKRLEDVRLFVPGELPRQKLILRKRPVVFASPNNPRALTVAKDIASAMGGRIDVTSEHASEVREITHYLLLLNDRTFLDTAGKELAKELRSARAAGAKVLLVHENDPERGGCEFGIFFDGRTPQDLVDDGIYYDIAVALHSGQFWPVSAALAAKGLGAITAADSTRHSFTTASATRTGVISGEWDSGRMTTRLLAAGMRQPPLNALISQDDLQDDLSRSATADGNKAALASRVAKVRRKMSILYGWYDDGAVATKDTPGRATYNRGSSDRRTLLGASSSTSIVSMVRNSECSETAAADKAAASKMAAMGLFSPAGVADGPAGPAWARGEVETPQGAIRTGNGYAVAVYTPEQQARIANNAPGVAAGVVGPTADASATTTAPPDAPTLGCRAGLGSLPAERERTTLSLPGPRPETRCAVRV